MQENLFKITKAQTASSSIEENLYEYADYLIDSKFPNPIDGLKDISRRVIYLMSTEKNDDLMTRFVAKVTNFHPHGEGNIHQVVHRLLQPAFYKIPFIHSDGNTGSYSNTDASASRYLEISSAEISRDLFFNNINNNTLPMKSNFDFTHMEPSYFIPRLPTALLIGNLTIGYGFKSVTFPLNLSNVCELVQLYIEHKNKDPLKEFQFNKHSELFIPDFPTKCYLRNYYQLMNNYKNNNYVTPVITDGTLTICKNNIIRLHNISAILPFNKMVEKTVEKLRDKNSWISNYCQDIKNLSADKEIANLKMTFKRNVNIFKLLEPLKQTIQFTGKLTPIYNYELNNKLINIIPPDILKIWFDMRYNSIVNGLNYDQNKLMKERLLLDALKIIVDNKDKVISTITNSDNRDHAVNKLIELFPLTMNQATIITKTSLERLVKSSKNEIEENIEKNKKDLQSVIEASKDILNIMYNDAVFFKKKYNRPRKTMIPYFIGFIKIDNDGLIQYTNENEMFEILNTFPNSEITIHQYRTNKRKVLIKDKKLIPEDELSIPKECVGTTILEYNGSEIYTLMYSVDRNSVGYIKGLVYPNKTSYKLQIVNKTFTGIHSDGVIRDMNIDELKERKTISTGVKHTLIHATRKEVTKNHVVLYASDAGGFKNTLILGLAKDDNDQYEKLMIPVPGNTYIIDILSINSTGIIINIPKECLDKNMTNHIYINNLKELIHGRSTQINFNSRDYLLNGKKVKIKKHDKYSNMLVL